MKLHSITVDVYAGYSDSPPRYRVYVDSDLLTERDFIWPGNQTYIKENIVVTLEPGEHTVKIEQVGSNGTITTRNITVDGVASLEHFTTT